VTLIDSNVIIDILTKNDWFDWSLDQVARRSAIGALYFDEMIYSELAVKSASEAALDNALDGLGLQLNGIPKEALYLAGKVFGTYRSRGGPRTSNLPDFFIGAHAQISGLHLVTRDPVRFRRYFPAVALTCPDE
jgi:hypothetical protein